MDGQISKLEAVRQNGDTQVEARRVSILEAAEALFLEKGFENTSMSDIADRAGITRVSLYRYFPNRDPIAFEVAVLMLRMIITTAAQHVDDSAEPIGMIKRLCLGMIHEFPALRGAYRYLGMFDSLYGDHYPSAELASWYKQHIFSLSTGGVSPVIGEDLDEHTKVQFVTLFNLMMSFLEKMAARGELMAEEQEAPLQAQFAVLEEIILEYLKSLGDEKPGSLA